MDVNSLAGEGLFFGNSAAAVFRDGRIPCFWWPPARNGISQTGTFKALYSMAFR
jgi:hypothetical protein